MEYVRADQLAAYLGVEKTTALDIIADRTNDLLDEKWTNPVDPIPAGVKNVAWNAAMRVASNPKGLTSWTLSWDDLTRTERIEGARRLGLYLTDDELAEINGTETVVHRVRSIPMTVPRLGPGGLPWNY